jgi:hypothetical protein
MSMTVSEFQDNLSAMLHGGTLNKVRNIESAMQRAANTLLSKIDPIDTMRTAALSETIHDDVFNYSLPSDYKKIIDLYPQNRRNLLDSANRNLVERFDLRKSLANKTVSIEGSEGSKVIRINWRSRQPKTLNGLDSLTANGTWSAVATASNVVLDDIDYVSGNGSIRFNSAASGDGVQNTDMTSVDLTDEDEQADLWVRFKVKNSTDLGNLTSVSLIWGNDLTTAYWTGVAQTAQADGTAFKVGWNEVKIPWSTATETGTVAPSTIDSLRVTFATTSAITQLKVDNITVSIGRNFDIKYYSKFLMTNSSGTFITKTSSGDDIIILDSDAIQIYMLESLSVMAHQIEGIDSVSDVNYSRTELDELYRRYKAEYPSQAKQALSYYGSTTSLRHFR